MATRDFIFSLLMSMCDVTFGLLHCARHESPVNEAVEHCDSKMVRKDMLDVKNNHKDTLKRESIKNITSYFLCYGTLLILQQRCPLPLEFPFLK